MSLPSNDGPSGGQGDLVGSINPSVPIAPASSAYGGNPLSSAYGATGSINVLSPGAGLNLGSTGIIMLALVAMVGVIFIIRDF